MKKGTKTLVILIVVLAVILGGGYLLVRAVGPEKLAALRPPASGGLPSNPAPAGEGEKFAAPVAVHTVRSGPARDTLPLYGSVYAQTEVSIFTTVPGKVTDIRASEGEAVRRGQVLALLDRDQAGLKFAPVEVTSTIDGIAKSVLVELGATANPGAPLFQIVNMDTVEVVVDVPEKRIAEVRPGLAAEVSVAGYPGRSFQASVGRLSPVVDPVSRTLEARIRVPNGGYLLKPGMFAEARIVLRSREAAPLLPLAALVDKSGRQVAFVVTDGTVRLVEPKVAFVDGELAVIDAGLSVGERVVVVGQQNLNDADPVSVVEER